VLSLLASRSAGAVDFQFGELFGLFNARISYGLLARVQGRDDDLVAIASGGEAQSADLDDGNLNYDKGIVSNVVRGTAELTLAWRWFGAFVRGYGFYDFETKLYDRTRTPLSGDAERLVGADYGLLSHYLSARFSVFEMPVQLRVGDQVIDWGETTFVRNGIDVINPVDLTQLLQPGAQPRDADRPQGMVWGVVNITDILSLEAFYQYEWKRVLAPPVGTYFSVNDAIGGDGLGFAMLGAGEVSDLGTDLEEAFGIPLGFDREFFKLPGLSREQPRDGGQYGFTLQAIVPKWNATKLAVHFVNYHSRLALINGFTADEDTIASTSQEEVDALALELVDDYGSTPEDAQAAAEALTISDYANAAGYRAVYPEDIKMLGFSFNTALLRTGTLVAAEVSHHFDWPLQIFLGEVVSATLSPIQFTGTSGQSPLGTFGAHDTVPGYIERDRTQFSLRLTQLFGPRLRAARYALGFDIAWVHIHDMPRVDDLPLNAPGLVPPLKRYRFPDEDSWGYRLSGTITYLNALGAINVEPFAVFTHDVNGTTPAPAGPFIEGRKSLTLGVGFQYVKAVTASLSYTHLFGAGRYNTSNDRDFVRFSAAYWF
jgi:hypothetical protein